MEQAKTIAKNRTLPRSQDYGWLRQAGIRRVEALGTDLWTDFNAHDPGVTILEVLCYAITDLGYRTRFDVRDLLARQPGQARDDFFTAAEVLTCNPVTILDFRKLVIDQEGVQNGWLRDRHAAGLPTFLYGCRSNGSYLVRMPDDVEDAFGALDPLAEAEPDLEWKDKVLNGLYDVRLQLEEHDEFGDLNTNVIPWEIEKNGETASLRVVFPRVSVRYPGWDDPITMLPDYGTVTGSTVANYLNADGEIRFDLTLEFDGEPAHTVTWTDLELLIDAPGVVVQQADIEAALGGSFAAWVARRYRAVMETVHEVYCALHRHRNLCEDYVRFEIVPTQRLVLCADIEVTPEADVEEVLARIYYEVDRFLAPPVRFYSLREMYEKGQSTEEVFQGIVPRHGFIDVSELGRSDLKSEVHVSDLYRLIMALDEVVTVDSLQLTNYLDGEPQTDGEQWCLKLGAEYHLDLDVERSKVLLFKDVLPFRADSTQVEKILRGLRAADARPPLTLLERDLPVPEGTPLEIEDYVSIQNDFPLVYGIGKEGLSREATDRRKAEAKQLKAFLMFFDQLLANYLAQLSSGRDLLSADPPALDRTYAVQPLHRKPGEADRDDFPGVAPLFADFLATLPAGADPDDAAAYATEWDEFTTDPDNGYLVNLRELVETRDEFLDRRNRFLDHLVARFSETFTDYALLMYTMDGKKSREELINDKEAFLAAYPEISAERGKAFQLKCYDAPPGETSWQESNVAGLKKRLCGLLGIDVSERRRLGYGDTELLQDFTIDPTDFGFTLTLDGQDVLESADTHASEAEAMETVRRVVRRAAQRDHFVVEPNTHEVTLLAGGVPLAVSPSPPADAETAEGIVEEILEHFQEKYHREGLHLFEHILLRPVRDQEVRTKDLEEGFFPECNLDRDCECPIRDHYSFRITLVLPYWPERFRNMDFRHYVERAIRRETPAHIHGRICWVDLEDMNRVEERYRDWLLQATRPWPTRDTLNTRTRNLVKALTTLTSVYPEGRLHDCEHPLDGEEAIMLDRSRLGTFEEDDDDTLG